MRILLADDQPKVRFALRVLLERQPGLKVVVDEAADAEDLLAQAEAACPDLVLLAWELPGLEAIGPSATPGKGLLSALREACPGLSVIVLCVRREMRQAALDAGADAFVCKCDPPERLLTAITDCCRDQHSRAKEREEAKPCCSIHGQSIGWDKSA